MEVGDRGLGETPAVVAVAAVPIDQPDPLDLAADGGHLAGPGVDDPLLGLFQVLAARVELLAAADAVGQRLDLAHRGRGEVAHQGEGGERLVVRENPPAKLLFRHQTSNDTIPAQLALWTTSASARARGASRRSAAACSPA